MSVNNYFSETVKGILQDIFPDTEQLFDRELKGTLVNFCPPCGKIICLVWAFPVKDGKNLDHVLYEQISGRAYTYYGEIQAQKCNVGEEYEDANKIIRVLEKNGEIYTEVFLKNYKFREEDVTELWNEYKMEYMRKYSPASFYRRPIACVYNNRNIWLLGVRNSVNDKENVDIIFMEGGTVKVDRSIKFSSVNLALPDNSEFF